MTTVAITTRDSYRDRRLAAAEKTRRIEQCMGQAKKFNWLVFKIELPTLYEAAERFAAGRLIDIGCATKPLQPLFNQFVTSHVGLDYPGSLHGRGEVDILGTADRIGLADHCAGTVLCTAVLEHLERPQQALNEMYRILKPGGHLIATVPLIWHVHEAPRDFFRYTEHGLDHLARTAGFEVVEIQALSGFVVTFAQEFCYFLQCLARRNLGPLVSPIQFTLQWLAYRLRHLDQSRGFTYEYLLVAKKPLDHFVEPSETPDNSGKLARCR
jgi:SAM-dependent methyltransferase